MQLVILRRFLNLSSLRYLPRAAPRLSDHEINKPAVANNDEKNSEAVDMNGKMVFDNQRQRTADPRVPLEKKRPKRTVEDVINATRKMRAKYFLKASSNATDKNFETDKDKPQVETEDNFFGIPVDSPSDNVKVERRSQYFDSSEDVSTEPTTENVEVGRLIQPPPRQIVEKPERIVFKKMEPRKAIKPIKVEEDEEESKDKYAFDVAMQVRRQLEGRTVSAQDSKGFRTMDYSTGPDWNTMTKQEMFNQFRKAIIYNADGIVAVNKPYGLACQGGPGTQVSVASNFRLLSEWLEKLQVSNQKEPEVQQNADKEEEKIWCRLAHRLDRDTTGVLLIATKQAVAAKLRYWFNERKVAKTYWAITKFVPKESEGIIDIPMYECELAGNIYRMNLIPASEASSKKDAVKAVTHYKVIDANSSSCALLELKPETGVKHQLRCHLGLGLATPILGDHKYSNADSIKPQRLPPAMLQSLGMRQAKARSIPLHLHAARLVLPEFVDGRTIVISARPPWFFIDTARRLKLKLPNF